MERISSVKDIKVNMVIFGSIVQIGDNLLIRPRNRAFAVQREIANFWGDEGSFSAYAAFSQAIPKPIFKEKVNMNVRNENPFIPVQAIKITSVSSSGVFQIGSNRIMDNEARIKHIRHLLPIYPQ